MAAADDFLADLADFDELLASKETQDARKNCILQHFAKIDKKRNGFIIPPFDKDLDWLNVTSPLQFGTNDSLKGKVVVLDFFTYCCVNCLHVLPDLHRLEKLHSVEDGLVVIGVHSAKFLNEKVTANIQSAVLRYDISHPVVNDSETSLWQHLSIMCWPTFVIVGPHGQVLYYIVGEGHSDLLFEFVSIAIEHYQGRAELSPHSLPLHLEKDQQREAPLHFPGKVCIGPNPDQLVVSDSGHHRLLILDRISGVVQTVIGGKEKGFKDGSLQEAMFNSPQGVASLGDVVFVADTENHALRQVDLSNGLVTTLAGTGVQGDDKEGGNVGTKQALSTPWDIVTGVSQGGETVHVVYIAMAGTHQIWAYFLKDVTWWKKKQYTEGTCARVVGSGNEENRNNSYPDKASLAQPSGLALSSSQDLNTLFVADSESSTVRAISLKDGCVKGLVGGDRDPLNLFAYGDVDGAGIDARLQHPLAVTLLSPSGPLLLADSYNHKIKSVDIKSKQCTTVLGSGTPGTFNNNDSSQAILNEPGGLCTDDEGHLVYIADTNNHCILVMDWSTKAVSQLPVVFSKTVSKPETIKIDTAALTTGSHLPEVVLRPGASIQFYLDLKLAERIHGNTDAPNRWNLSAGDTNGQLFLSSFPENSVKGKLCLDKPTEEPLSVLKISSGASGGSLTLVLTFQVFVCHPDNTCTQHRHQCVQLVKVSSDGLGHHKAVAVVEIE